MKKTQTPSITTPARLVLEKLSNVLFKSKPRTLPKHSLARASAAQTWCNRPGKFSIKTPKQLCTICSMQVDAIRLSA
jgi:hypothetical protein